MAGQPTSSLVIQTITLHRDQVTPALRVIHRMENLEAMVPLIHNHSQTHRCSVILRPRPLAGRQTQMPKLYRARMLRRLAKLMADWVERGRKEANLQSPTGRQPVPESTLA